MTDLEKNLIVKRLQTTMIGALYEFEENFGYLWGLDKEPNELNESQIKFRNLWEDTRNRVLNNGNNQIRKCIADLRKVNKQYFKYNYYFKNNSDERE